MGVLSLRPEGVPVSAQPAPVCDLLGLMPQQRIALGALLVDVLIPAQVRLRAPSMTSTVHNLVVQHLRSFEFCHILHEVAQALLYATDVLALRVILAQAPPSFRQEFLLRHAGTARLPDALLQQLELRDVDVARVTRERGDAEALGDLLNHFQAQALTPGIALFDYQRNVLAWMVRREIGHDGFRGGIVALDPGMGKTFLALSLVVLMRVYMNRTLDEPAPTRPTLVLTPLSVFDEWTAENKSKFQEHARLRLYFWHGDQTRAKRDLRRDCDVIVTTIETFLNNWREIVDEAAPFERLVVDESQALSNGDTKRYKRLVTEVLPRAPFLARWGLSGTPFRNRSEDIVSQLLLFGYIPPAGVVRDPEAIAGATNLFMRHVYQLTYGPDTRELPPRVDVVKEHDLDESERALYTFVMSGARAMAKASGTQQAVFANRTTAMTRLRQAVLSFALIPREDYERLQDAYTASLPFYQRWARHATALSAFILRAEQTRPTPSSRLRAVIEVMQEIRRKGEKMLVFSAFAEALNLLVRNLTEGAGWTAEDVGVYMGTQRTSKDVRRDTLETFKVPESPMCALCITYTAGGAGLNIQVANHVLFLDEYWNDAMMRQAEARAWRTGQGRTVYTYTFTARDTIDDKVHGYRMEKRGRWKRLRERAMYDAAGVPDPEAQADAADEANMEDEGGALAVLWTRIFG
jgi:SNF2 family DNA or RNA helicase